MTITLKASEHVLQVLDAAGVRYVIVDPAKALAEECERGKKFREGSPKHRQHLERMAKLRGMDTFVATALHENDGTVSPVVAKLVAPSVQSDAVGALMALQGVARSVAEKMIQQCDGRTADEIVTQALRRAS